MREWKTSDFIKVLKRNGFTLKKGKGKGSHSLYINENGKRISVPLKIKAVIARRLIKENNLII